MTLLLGSFLAGSSPEGGGAVAFPVFTKVLDVPAPVARTFGLSIQAVGMTMAVLAILLVRRPMHARGALVGSVAAVAGLLVGAFVAGDRSALFWPPTIGTAWVKATFSIVLAATSVLMVRHLRGGDVAGQAPGWTRRTDVGLVLVAFGGGFLSSLTGTGANIVVFLFLVVLVDVAPKTALPTAIVVMAVVSLVGFVLYGIVDGQLDVAVDGDRVTSVGGTPVDLPASENDLFGLWLAAVPVVVWGAPLGSWVAARVRERVLVWFVAALATIEVATTVVLVPEIRGDPTVVAYVAAGVVVVPWAFVALRSRRAEVFGQEAASSSS